MRVREVAALSELSARSDIGVVTQTVETHVQNDVKTATQFVTHPVGTITGIPRGIGHLFGGIKAQTHEVVDRTQKDTRPCDASTADASTAGEPCRTRTRELAEKAKSDATRYADRYLGLSAAERRYYEQLHVDPYTRNEVLRKAVHHVAKIEAVTNLGLHVAAVPGVPYLSDVRRAMDTIYNEDPAVLRARRRQALAEEGLSAAEIERFENTLLLSPTRQVLLEDAVSAMKGVDGRDEIYRHAMSVTTETEMEVFIDSVRLLVRLHGAHPFVHVLPGLRMPGALTQDGRVVVAAAFDAVYWTADVAQYESAMHAALPGEIKALEGWVGGRVSPRARRELTALGWQVHDQAWTSLPEQPSEPARPAH